jgi:prolyl-tRNA synthetase
MPASLWDESGRLESVGSELVRLYDRNKTPLVLGMTHEEAAVQLVRDYAKSYGKYPFMIYQIQTKFRDEARPRGGLIRVREFIMKDAYSFHTSQEDLERYYARCFKAYERIFARVGILQVISVTSDSGMMGGSISHEFMLLTPVGEDSIVTCLDCDYCANMEAAESILINEHDEVDEPLMAVHTPGSHTIKEVCSFLKMPQDKSCKAVVYQKESDGQYVVLFIRGDLEVNETKLTNFLGCEVYPAEITPESGLVAGYIGPFQLSGRAAMLFDRSLEGTNNLCCGGNRAEFHYTGLCIARDVGLVEYHDFSKVTKDGICPRCGNKSLSVSRGIEVGNIFQLGTKYTKAMGMQYLDSDGAAHYPLMGCYGIGIGRLAASVCEAHHDEHGPIWPISIAPWQVHLCAVRSDDEVVRRYADELYSGLHADGVEVLYDDRNVSAGVQFSDADLLGIPVRVIVSPRNLKEKCCEIVFRNKSLSYKEPLVSARGKIKELVQNLLQGK